MASKCRGPIIRVYDEFDGFIYSYIAECEHHPDIQIEMEPPDYEEIWEEGTGFLIGIRYTGTFECEDGYPWEWNGELFEVTIDRSDPISRAILARTSG